MSNRLFALVQLLFVSVWVSAQNDVDALRYSMLQFGSTARASGVGGAFGAIGGDFGSLSMNPAGIGVYRSSELQFSPAFSVTGTRSTYAGQTTTDSRANLHVGSVGLVFTNLNNKYYEGSGLRRVSSSFAFGINRLSNFSAGREYTGFNADNSLLNSYEEFLNFGAGTPTNEAFDADPFGAGLAYDAFLLNPLPGDSNRYAGVVPDGGVWQSRSIQSREGVNEMVMAFGGNFGNKLYIGGSIGVPFIRYVETSTYREEDREELIEDFQSFEQESRLDVSGTGLQARFGLIIRPADAVRIGASIHSPTRYRLRDEYTAIIQSNLEDNSYEVFSPFGLFDYSIRTPWRTIGSLGFILKEFGFISLDYEYLDYGNSSLDFSRSGLDFGSQQSQINQTISEKYGSAHNFRGGMEFKADPMRIRVGYSYLATPFNTGRATGDYDLSRHSFSAGLGYRSEVFFADLAYIHSLTSAVDVPYQLNDPSEPIPFAEMDEMRGQLVISAGVRF